MSKQHFAGFLAALALTAVQYVGLEAGSAAAPQDRGNPAVAEDVQTGGRVVGTAGQAADHRVAG